MNRRQKKWASCCFVQNLNSILPPRSVPVFFFLSSPVSPFFTLLSPSNTHSAHKHRLPAASIDPALDQHHERKPENDDEGKRRGFPGGKREKKDGGSSRDEGGVGCVLVCSLSVCLQSVSLCVFEKGRE